MEESLISIAICTAGLAALAVASPPAAADDVSFAGKTITMTIGNAAGSGIDLYGIVAKTDPGSPQVSKVDLERLVRELSKVFPDVLDYILSELRRQGFIK